MTNQDTISKLNEALNTLIKAYEQLQNENISLKESVKNLENGKKDLEAKNKRLENNVNELNNSSQKQNNNISSMLMKIENLLGNKKEERLLNTNLNQINIGKEKSEANMETKVSNEASRENSYSNKYDPKKNTEDNKLDLNRMASLLNGFNK